MAEDYRNISSRLFVKGLDIAHPFDDSEPQTWTKLENVDPVVAGVLQARPMTDLYTIDAGKSGGFDGTSVTSGTLTNAQFPTYLATPTGIAHDAEWYFSVVGQVKDGTDYVDAVVHLVGTLVSGTYYYNVYLNGIPLCIMESYDGTTYTGYRLITSTKDIVVTTGSVGQPVVIVGGEAYVDLSNIDLNALDQTDDFTQKFPVVNDAGSVTTAYIDYIPAYKLGITAPDTAPTVSASNTGGGLDSGVTGASDYTWRYTWYREEVGAESAMSPASTAIAVEGANDTGNMTSIPCSDDPQVTKIRIYRLGGVLPNDWRLVKTIANTFGAGATTTSTTDTEADSDVALNDKGDTTKKAPFPISEADGTTTEDVLIPRSFGPFQGRFVFYTALTKEQATNGTGASTYRAPGASIGKSTLKTVSTGASTSYVWWTNLNDPFRVDPELGFTEVGGVDEELFGGFIFSAFPFVYSRDAFYALDYGGPDARPIFTARKLPFGMGAYEIAVAPDSVYFANDKGIWRSDMNASLESITDETLYPLFHGDSINSMSAISTVTLWYAEPFLFMRTAAGDMMVFDTIKGRWWKWAQGDLGTSQHEPLAAWRDPVSRKTYLGPSSKENSGSEGLEVWEFANTRGGTGETSFAVSARSNSWDAAVPHTEKLFGVLMVDFDPDGADITIIPYYDTESTAGTTLTTDTDADTNGRRVKTFDLGDVYAKNIAFDFGWTETATKNPKIYKITVLYRADEEEIVHWESPEDAFGHEGYFHLRDGYFDIRSNAAVTLKLTVDGTEHTYTLASTSGARRKVYQEFAAVRAKVIKLELDSSATFRFYSDTSTLYAKPWQSQLGYKPILLAGQAGYADFLRKGGGT
jgi:hypothetical protein